MFYTSFEQIQLISEYGNDGVETRETKQLRCLRSSIVRLFIFTQNGLALARKFRRIVINAIPPSCSFSGQGEDRGDHSGSISQDPVDVSLSESFD